MAERFTTLPSIVAGLRFDGCDTAMAYDFDQAVRMRLAYKDAEEWEQAKERAEDARTKAEKKARRAG